MFHSKKRHTFEMTKTRIFPRQDDVVNRGIEIACLQADMLSFIINYFTNLTGWKQKLASIKAKLCLNNHTGWKVGTIIIIIMHY